MDGLSDRPTLRPGPERIFARLKKIANVVYVVGGAMLSAAIWSYGQYQQLATDAELSISIASHNNQLVAHPSILDKLNKIEELCTKNGSDIRATREDAIALGERLVSLLAADKTTDHAKRAAVATFYREEYRRLIRRGFSVDDAVLEALRTPYSR